jgi:hypothetical protein
MEEISSLLQASSRRMNLCSWRLCAAKPHCADMAKLARHEQHWLFSASCNVANCVTLDAPLRWSTRNKAQALWPRCGFGCLSLIHLSPSFFQLDASKTRVQRRECEATHNLSQRQLVQALRLSIAVWCCTNMPPELPREPSVRSRRGVHALGLRRRRLCGCGCCWEGGQWPAVVPMHG